MSEGRPLAVVAGATGFLGRRLIARFDKRCWRVRALVRREADREALEREGVETTPGDLSDLASLKRLCEGAAVVINSAGLIKARDRKAFMAVNRDGAGRLAAAAPIRHVLVSSLAAREPKLSDYAGSKQAGEAAARVGAGDRLAVIRPPVIYGPGDRETLALFRAAARWLVAPLPGDAAARLALAHADDVADAILHLVATPELAGVYAVGGDRPAGYAWREIAEAACRAVGRTPPILAVPNAVIAAAGVVSETLGRLGDSTPIFNRGKARELLHADWSVTPGEQAPGAPPACFSLGAGFADAVAWYRHAGWL